MEAVGIRAAGPQPEVAPNHERRGSARVALIAGSGGTQPRGPTPWRPPLGSVPEATGSEKHNAAAFPGERVRISRTHIRH